MKIYPHHLHERLGKAILDLMMATTPAEIASAFNHLDSPHFDKTQFDDPDAQRWWQAIRDGIKPSDGDANDPRREVVGARQILVERMSREERYEVVVAIFELSGWIGRAYR